MTAQAITERKYYVIGRALFVAEFVTGHNSFFRKPGTEKCLGEFESNELAKKACLDILKETGLMPDFRPAIATTAF